MYLIIVILNFLFLQDGHAQKAEKCIKQTINRTYFFKLSSLLKQTASDYLQANKKSESENIPNKMNDMISTGEVCKHLKPEAVKDLEVQHTSKLKFANHAIRELATKKKLPGYLFDGFGPGEQDSNKELTEDEICINLNKRITDQERCSVDKILASKTDHLTVDHLNFEETCKKAAPAIAAAKRAEEKCYDDVAKEKRPGEEITPDDSLKKVAQPRKENNYQKKSIIPREDSPIQLTPTQNLVPTSGRQRGASGQ